ncbi:hypothetical protein [Flavobacterium johnsoniae]|uniref:SGNH/GDSL hydrolase family protein n=1 Tax=Flavobacterium johnsoniae TaxID=986 RepID=A0A1M5L164_FLAJO|nr:hypothetical protein [Flavobacterium johnsoniae]SHG58788.1 hypothetical protein SAMN05444388_103292 [Flavobacterium johnsoniae]
MKTFFKYILEIVVLTLIFAFGIQYLSDNGLRNLEGSQYNDWKNILAGTINSDIIINGSSRGYVGYNPKVIGDKLNASCFNLSFNAGGYNLQQDKFEIYSKRNKKPKIIIQNIDLAYFGKNTELPEESQFYPFLNDELVKSLTAKFDKKFNLFRIIPLIKYNQNFKMLEEGFVANFSNSVKKKSKTIQGYCPQDRVFKIDYHNLKKFPIIDVKPNNDKELKLLHKMIDFYNSRLNTNSKIIFVWMPEYKLRLTESFDLKRESILDELKLIQAKNKNFIFIDMAYDEMSNDSEYYYDTFHLNERGSNVFSKKISTKISHLLN